MDGSIDASTAQQRMVGRIDDRVDALLGDIALHKGDLHSHNTIAGNLGRSMGDEFVLLAGSNTREE